VSDRQDPGVGENLDAIYTALRWNGVELAAQRIALQAREALAAFNREITHQQRLHDLAVVVPDESERTAYLEAAEGNPRQAMEWAQWGLPADLAAQNRDMPTRVLIDMARQLDTEEGRP
jgi:hypothetical protein